VLLRTLQHSEPALWERATKHPFLQGVGSGRTDSFEVWLRQDALFVSDLIEFQSRLVARAPRSAQRILATGVVGLVEELDWFDAQADRLEISIPAEPLQATRAYRELLRQLDTAPYKDALAALWLIERVYLEAWQYARSCGAGGRHAAAISHWTQAEFVGYVMALEQRVVDLNDHGSVASVDVLRRVLVCEAAFWDMAVAGDPA
jgi:thiaminase/transcriptional activator TenA